ncbi:hypothetical protein V8C44DRAFT_314427, partial [Trichoderma aethiopicum]
MQNTYQTQPGHLHHPNRYVITNDNKKIRKTKRGRLNTAAFYDAGLWTGALFSAPFLLLPFPCCYCRFPFFFSSS